MNGTPAGDGFQRACAVVRRCVPESCHDRVLLVGGTVRDLLLGRGGRDLDLVGAVSHDELVAAGFAPVAPASATPIYVRSLPGAGLVELTRIDSLAALPADLERRDFRCNAIALDLAGRLVDPLRGEDDVRSRLLRVCSGQSLADDPLRIFRAFRFEAHGWRMAPETAGLVRGRAWDEALRLLPVERFSGEMLRALAGERPERFFELMVAYGVGRGLLPELFRMPQIPAGPPQHHPEGDLLTHCIQVLRQVAAISGEPLARFCAFFHDLGKLASDPAHYPHHHGHDEAGFRLALPFCSRLRLPAAYRRSLAWISRLHGIANKWGELRDATRIRTAEQARRNGVTGLLQLVSGADKPGGLPPAEWRAAVDVAGMTGLELGIEKELLAGMPVPRRKELLLQRRIEALRLRSRPDA